MQILILSPAYGRDYKSKKAVLSDWDNNKDFIINNIICAGQYVNRQQLPALLADGYTTIEFRYSRMTRLCLLPLPKP